MVDDLQDPDDSWNLQQPSYHNYHLKGHKIHYSSSRWNYGSYFINTKIWWAALAIRVKSIRMGGLGILHDSDSTLNRFIYGMKTMSNLNFRS